MKPKKLELYLAAGIFFVINGSVECAQFMVCEACQYNSDLGCRLDEDSDYIRDKFPEYFI